jgi:hypothetical protein
VYIYKDDRNYGKQSLLKHNNGVHNYTLHEIDFISKRLGKDIGITFNKEISMNGNNDLITVIKSALKESRDEFTADTSVKKNKELCEKAIKKGLIHLNTCPIQKLSYEHKSKRIEIEKPAVTIHNPKTIIKPVFIIENDPNDNNMDNNIDQHSDKHSEYSFTEPLEFLDVVSEEEQKQEFDSLEYTSESSQHDDQKLDQTSNDEPDTEESRENIETDDLEKRKQRTRIIIEELYKTIQGACENVLSDDELRVFENLIHCHIE